MRGVLEHRCKDGIIRATITEDGWECEPPSLTGPFNAAFPPPSTEVGNPLVQAFWTAVHDLDAEVIEKPAPRED